MHVIYVVDILDSIIDPYQVNVKALSTGPLHSDAYRLAECVLTTV